MTRKIGITNHGDAGIDFQWVKVLEQSNSLDCAVILTRCLNEEMVKPLLRFQHKIILGISASGYAGTAIEPHTPATDRILQVLSDLLDKGFPQKQVLLHIAPVISTAKGLKRANEVFHVFSETVTHIRTNLIETNPVIQERFAALGMPLPDIQAKQQSAFADMVSGWKRDYPESDIAIKGICPQNAVELLGTPYRCINHCAHCKWEDNASNLEEILLSI